MPRIKDRKIRYKLEVETTSDGLNTLNYRTDEVQNYRDTRSDGFANPSWRQRIKKLESATTSLQGVKCHVKHQPGRYYKTERFLVGTQWVTRTSRAIGYPQMLRLASEPGAVAPNYSKADAIASKKFYRKVKQAEQSFNGLQWLGELNESIRMFRNPLKALRRSAQDDYLAALGKLKRRQPKSWRNGIADTYLEWFYGWRPILYDIDDAYSTFERLSTPRVERCMIHAVGKDRISQSSNVLQSSDEYGFAFNYKENLALEAKVVYKGLYAREVLRSGDSWGKYQDTMTLLGLTMENFVPTSWELLPWSFLVDYFSNVGDILEQTFTSLQKVRWINRTQRGFRWARYTSILNEARTMSMNSGVPWKQCVGAYQKGPDGFVDVEKVSFDRGTQGPTVATLQFEVPSSPSKWIAMAALLSPADELYPQAYRRRNRRSGLS